MAGFASVLVLLSLRVTCLMAARHKKEVTDLNVVGNDVKGAAMGQDSAASFKHHAAFFPGIVPNLPPSPPIPMPPMPQPPQPSGGPMPHPPMPRLPFPFPFPRPTPPPGAFPPTPPMPWPFPWPLPGDPRPVPQPSTEKQDGSIFHYNQRTRSPAVWNAEQLFWANLLGDDVIEDAEQTNEQLSLKQFQTKDPGETLPDGRLGFGRFPLPFKKPEPSVNRPVGELGKGDKAGTPAPSPAQQYDDIDELILSSDTFGDLNFPAFPLKPFRKPQVNDHSPSGQAGKGGKSGTPGLIPAPAHVKLPAFQLPFMKPAHNKKPPSDQNGKGAKQGHGSHDAADEFILSTDSFGS